MSFGFDINDGFSGFNVATPADGCTQCGICVGSCPTFQQSEDPRQSPMGRIRLIRQLNEGAELADDERHALQSCIGCYTCERVCPSRVDYSRMHDEALETLASTTRMNAMVGWMLSLSQHPKWLTLLTRLGAIAQCFGLRRLLGASGLIKVMGLQRADKVIGAIRFPHRQLHNQVHSDRKVALFQGCFSSVLEEEVHLATLHVLNALSVEVKIPKTVRCCGALHQHNGERQQAKAMAEANIKQFNQLQVEAILTTSSGCGDALQHYPQWLGEEQPGFDASVMDASHYIDEQLKRRKVVFDHKPLKVALHTPCSLRRGEGQTEAVTSLLSHIPELELLPLAAQSACCGAGGSHLFSEPETADALRDVIIDEIKQHQPDVVVSSNLGCALHLRAGLAEVGIAIEVKHPLQLLAEAMVVEFVSVGAQARQ